jgi:hypothetical protein
MIYIIVSIWIFILSIPILIRIGKNEYKKQLKKELKNKTDQQILDRIYNELQL